MSLAPLSEVDSRAERLVAEYRDAEAQLRSTVAAAVTGSGSARAKRKARVGARRSVGLLEAKSRPLAAGLVRLAYVRGMRLVDDKAKLGDSELSTVNSITQSLNTRLSAASATVNSNITDVFRRLILQSTAKSLLQNDDFSQAMQMLGVTGFIDRSGKRWGLEQYAKTAIRTASRQAATEATVRAMNAAGLDLLNVPFLPDPSPQCEQWNGGTFSLAGLTPGIEIITRLPPFHPNCEHWIEPVV